LFSGIFILPTPFLDFVPQQGQFVFETIDRRQKASALRLANSFRVSLKPHCANRPGHFIYERRLLRLGGCFSRTAFGFRQTTSWRSGRGQALFVRHRQDNSHRAFDFAGGEFLLRNRQE
jgi:hypothetical protein